MDHWISSTTLSDFLIANVRHYLHLVECPTSPHTSQLSSLEHKLLRFFCHQAPTLLTKYCISYGSSLVSPRSFVISLNKKAHSPHMILGATNCTLMCDLAKHLNLPPQ